MLPAHVVARKLIESVYEGPDVEASERMADIVHARMDQHDKQASWRVMGMYWGGKAWFLLAMGRTRQEAEDAAAKHERDIKRKGLGKVQFHRLERRHGEQWFFCAGQ